MSFASLLAGQSGQGSSFLLGTPAEHVLLFGVPLPELPPGDSDAGGRGERITVETSPRLREAFARWVAAADHGLTAGPGAGAPDAEAERAYHGLLAEALRAAGAADRRQGLVNLFWLAHSREIAEEVERHFGTAGRDAGGRYRLYALLAGILRRADEVSRVAAARPQQSILDFRRGRGSDALVRSVIDDQLTLTESDPRRFDPERVLVEGNGRFHITAAAFIEIREILRGRLARGVSRGERALLASVRAACPVALPAAGDPPGCWDRFIFAEPVFETLLRDLDGTGGALLRSSVLNREIGRGSSWAELFERFADVTRCVRRAEIVGALRGALDFTTRSVDHQETRELFLEGRLFRLGRAGPAQSGVRTSTILFADIRGFTRASEGPVSEGELARELYEIFDPAALIVRRFGGSVDTYLGDGFMATFTGGTRPGDEALAAVRTAVVLQQVLGRLRRLGRTSFTMGISLHSGRVAVARFLLDESRTLTTIIGRQVNVAGRLSASAGELESGHLDGVGHRVGNVGIDAGGRLVNHGIAVSGPMLEVLRAQVAGEPFREEGFDGVRWFDRDLCVWLHFGYVGEARFRGLEASVPVYSLVPAPPAAQAAQAAP